MKSWVQNLNSLADEHGRKVGSVSKISNIVIEFMKEEIYPRLLLLKNELNTSGLKGTLSPESIDKIIKADQIVGLSINNKNNIEYSLKFQQEKSVTIEEKSLNIGVTVIVKNGQQILSTIAINSQPVPPTILLEKCIEEFKGRI